MPASKKPTRSRTYQRNWDNDNLNRLQSNLDESAKNGRHLYFIFLIFVIFCSITTIRITDLEMIVNITSINIPLVRVHIPLGFFFILAPIISIIIFLYFNLYFLHILKIKQQILNIDSQYESENRIYPWIFLFNKPITKFITIICFWSPLPIMLLLIAVKYAKLHEKTGALLLGILPLIIVLYSIKFNNNIRKKINHHSISRLKHILIWFGNVFIILLFITLTCLYFKFFYHGLSGNKKYYLGIKTLQLSNVLDLSYKDLVTVKNKELKYWGNMQGVHLEGANLTGANLEKMDLRKSFFNHAILSGANLNGANLSNAHMDGADMISTHLENADLSFTSMIGVCLMRAYIENADLSCSNMTGASLMGAYMQGVNLHNSKLVAAILIDANLTGANLHNVDLAATASFGVHLEGANLQEANLEIAKLGEAFLEGADFEKANLKGAQFNDIQLDCVNFRNSLTENFNASQLDYVVGSLEHEDVLYLRDLVIKDIKERSNKPTEFKGSKGVNIFHSGQAELKSFSNFNPQVMGNWSLYRIKRLKELSVSNDNIQKLFTNGLPNHFRKNLTDKDIDKLKREGIYFRKYKNIYE